MLQFGRLLRSYELLVTPSEIFDGLRALETVDLNDRAEVHLAGKNGLKLDGLNYRLGRKLTFDPATESIPGDPDASKLLFAPYRAPFIVEDRVV